MTVGLLRPWLLPLWLSALSLLLGSVLSLRPRSAPAAPTPEPTVLTVTLPPRARDAPARPARAFPLTKAAKLDSALADVAALSRAGSGVLSRRVWAESSGVRLVDGAVQVQIRVAPGAAAPVTAAVKALGGSITGAAQGDGLLQGWLPPRQLAVLTRRSDVLYVRRPQPLQLLGDLPAPGVNSQALDTMNASAWHASGWRGRNVRVGVIDSGFAGYPALLGTELPASVMVGNFADGEGTEQVDSVTRHGTAIAEIVHDVAPEAELLLARVQTDVDLEEAVAWLMQEQVDVIVTAIGWYNLTPGDGTGAFADLVQSAEDAGILWVTAAGNDREHHWGGLFSDPDLDGYHNFGFSQEVNFFGPGGNTTYLIPPGFSLALHVRWDDWEDVDQDYDLLLVRWNGSEWETIASSRNPQDGHPGQTPTESLTAVTTGDPTAYGFLIVKYRATSSRPANFEIFAPRFFRPSVVVAPRSLPNLADAPRAITVAAVDVNPPYGQESYSSEGPTNGPGGGAEGGRTKPDIAAYTNVSTASYGFSLFDGTSAAAPHVAGAAALVAGAYPEASPAEWRRFLEERALDLDAPGKDTRTGSGRLFLGAPPANLVQSRMSVFAAQVEVGASATYTIHLVNRGGVTTTASLVNPLPANFRLSGRPLAIGGSRPVTPTDILRWSGPIGPGRSVLLVYRGALTGAPGAPVRVINTATVSDDEGRRYALSVALNPLQLYLPSLER